MLALSTMAVVVNFGRFISSAPGSSSRSSTSTMSQSHHCSLRWRNRQMIIDALDANYCFYGDSGSLLFVIRGNEAPQIDVAVMYGHVEQGWPPQLGIQSGEHLVTDFRIIGVRSGCALRGKGGKRLKQVCAAHDSHDFSILHNRHSFDTISFQQSCDFAERGIRRRGNHRARHDIAD